MAYPSLVAATKDVSFPVDKKALVRKFGDREVEVLVGHTMTLRELLRACPSETFNNQRDIVGCREILDKIRKAG